MKTHHNRILCALLTLVLISSLFPSVFAYSGVSNWAKKEIAAMDELGLIPGSLADANMGRNISRLDMCRVAVLAYEKLNGAEIPLPQEHPFSDTTDPDVEKAKAARLISGDGNGKFRPNDNLTRLEFFAIVAQFLNAVDFPVSEENYADISGFSDAGSLPRWGVNHARLTVGLGIVAGSDGGLDWRSATSREQGLALFYRTYQVVLPMFEDSDEPDEPKAIATGTVQIDGYLRVRSGPGTGYDEVGRLYNGDRVEIFEIVTVGTSQWGRISNGWICLDYVVLDSEQQKPTEPEPPRAIATGTVIASGFLRVRSGPGTDYEEVDRIYNGDRIEIFEIVTVGTSQWGRISNGWICLDYVILDPDSDVVTKGQEVVKLAMRYLGYDYTYAGKSPEEGFDCSGFVYYIYKQFGYTLSPGATNQWNKLSDRKVLSQDELIPGDLVFFSGNGQVSGMEHVGIYIGEGQFIHAANPSKGVIITALSESYYASRYLGGKRVIVD